MNDVVVIGVNYSVDDLELLPKYQTEGSMGTLNRISRTCI